MKNNILFFSIFTLSLMVFSSCQNETKDTSKEKISIIIDTDANNELDDQHALAYAFCNADIFDIVGVTVSSTRVGGGIEGHYQEAVRIAKLCKANGKIPIEKGAEGIYRDIKANIHKSNFDGSEAVNFIIESSKDFDSENKLLIIAVGKLTNIALAIARDSSIIERVKLLWLGSNYPNPGEYNLENDTTSLNPVFQSGMEVDIALVGYGRTDGTDAVKVPIKEIEEIMPGLGPEISDSIEGRNGGYFNNFGDYAVNLWQNMDLYGEQQTRSLFDLAAVAVVKDTLWSERKVINSPYWRNDGWDLDYNSQYTAGLYYNFEKDSIINDFISSLERPFLSEE